MRTVTFFDTLDELRELTGLPGDDHDKALWDAGFNLDDWDFGLVSDEEWDEDGWWNDPEEVRYYVYWLMTSMDHHCVGYGHTEYNGRHYYIAYHS